MECAKLSNKGLRVYFFDSKDITCKLGLKDTIRNLLFKKEIFHSFLNDFFEDFLIIFLNIFHKFIIRPGFFTRT